MPGTLTSSWLTRAALMLLAYLLMQDLIVIAHEHVHSTMAWLLGYTRTPFTVVWGNPIAITGWDEGVPYDAIFPEPGNAAEALIGVMPLLMHAAFIGIGLVVLLRTTPSIRAVPFHLVYWFVVINLGELVSYIVMRPFIPTGDTGRFNEGLNISPWLLFIAGMVFLATVLWLMLCRVTPRLALHTDGTRLTRMTIIIATAFSIFLWDSGLRMMALYPDPQWRTGPIGLVAFAGWILIHRRQSWTRNSVSEQENDASL